MGDTVGPESASRRAGEPAKRRTGGCRMSASANATLPRTTGRIGVSVNSRWACRRYAVSPVRRFVIVRHPTCEDASRGPAGQSIFAPKKVFLLAARKFADIAFQRFRLRLRRKETLRLMMRQPHSEPAELLGDWHPLFQQLGSTEGLIALSTASHSLQLNNVDSVETLLGFLEAYQFQILIPHELPAIQRAYRHASRHETRELIAWDQLIGAEPVLKPFANASRRVGQAQLKRLRPLRDHRLLQRYLRAVEEGAAQGWHTLVYGVTLSVYSLPVLQG